jgi:hypothetical protein
MSITQEYKREQSLLQSFLGEVGEMFEQSSGFVQRRSKIGGQELIQILTLGCLANGEATLENFCDEVAQDLDISLSASGLHQRLHMEAVELLRQTCQLWMDQSTQSEKRRDVLCCFEAVHIVDSSRIHLPKKLNSYFKGSRNGATMKVQLAYEYHSGRIEALEIEDARCPDQVSPIPQQISQTGDLVLFDLGYFDQNRFAELDNDGVFFLSRLQSQTGVYDEDGTRIPILEWLNSLPDSYLAGERDVRLGSHKRVPVRLIYYRLPPDVVAERRRKAKQQAKKQGKTCTQHSLDWLQWMLFITNVPAQMMSVEQVATVYRVRWQIELLFKVWKQEMDWGKMRQWRLERMLCQFYARCLALLMFHGLLEKYQYELDWQVSWQKALRLFKRKAQTLIDCVCADFHGLLRFLKRFDRDVRRFARQSTRQTSLSTYDLLKLVRA